MEFKDLFKRKFFLFVLNLSFLAFHITVQDAKAPPSTIYDAAKHPSIYDPAAAAAAVVKAAAPPYFGDQHHGTVTSIR